MNLSSLWSLQGRVARGKFWLVFLLTFVFSILSISFWALISTLLKSFSPTAPIVIGVLWFVLIISLGWISIATTVKRFHDRNKSGWWYFISFVPVIGFFWIIIECGFMRGTVGANDFGEDPVR